MDVTIAEAIVGKFINDYDTAKLIKFSRAQYKEIFFAMILNVLVLPN